MDGSSLVCLKSVGCSGRLWPWGERGILAGEKRRAFWQSGHKGQDENVARQMP